MSKARYAWTELTAIPVHMYVESIYAIPYQDAEDNTKYRFYLIARKQRSVDPYSHTAGNYITNIGGKLKDGSEWNFHSQLISRKTFDKILAASGCEPMEDEFIQFGAANNQALVNSHDDINFIAKVKIDPNHEKGYRGLPTYLIRNSTIQFNPYPYKFDGWESKWEDLASVTMSKLNTLLQDEKNSELVLDFIARPDFPLGQYESPTEADAMVNDSMPNPNSSKNTN